LISNVLSWTASPSVDVVRYEACFYLPKDSSIGCKDGAWRKIESGEQLTHFVVGGISKEFESGESYFIEIRAIDTSENESEVTRMTFEYP